MEYMNLFSEQTIEDKESRIYNLTNSELEQINLANRIRKVVLSRNFKIDDSPHSRNTNKVLYDYIEACGFTVRNFIISYLGSIQPYCIQRNHAEEYDKGIRCIIDPTYKIPLYLKIDFTQHDECLISFHENHFTKLTKFKYESGKYVVLFADDIRKLDNDLGIRFTTVLYRGMEKFNIEGYGYNIKDNVIKCEMSIIEDQFNGYVKEILQLYINTNARNTFKYLKVSFTSYGLDSMNKLSLLIDYYLSGISSTQEKSICMYAINHTIIEIQKRSDGRHCLEIFNNRLKYIQSNKLTYVKELLLEVLSDAPVD